MKIISWNVAHRVSKQKRQLSALISRKPDVIGLQEVTSTALSLWEEELQKKGYITLSSFDLYNDHSKFIGPRKYGILIASRWPIDPIDQSSLEIEWPERLVSALIRYPKLNFEFHVAHIPCGSSHGRLKIDTIIGIYNFLARKNNKYPRILCGDFNMPQAETRSGEVITWAQKICKDGQVKLKKRKRGRRGDEWDAGERTILQGLAKYDLHDMFRLRNGYKSQEFSWLFRLKGKIVARRRFDHLFASEKLNPVTCGYIHSCREKLLSDHSPIEATFKI
jgi:exonuclease III